MLAYLYIVHSGEHNYCKAQIGPISKTRVRERFLTVGEETCNGGNQKYLWSKNISL